MPTDPPALDSSAPHPSDTHIVRAAIHPGIGLARLGNSTAADEHGFFIGPEVTDPPPAKAHQLRDADGAIKRQAARFRIYGYNQAGEVVRELTSKEADIRWTAHLVNRKAEWYCIKNALDIPENKDLVLPLRNPDAKEGSDLAIDPGPRTITGSNMAGPPYRFDSGTFLGQTVPLGELRTDQAGRLLVLGGFGKSGSPTNTPIFDPKNPLAFNNAPGWYDDISDGPVDAQVVLDGRELPVESAWVAVAPPNYSPDLVGWRTLNDLVEDLYAQTGMIPMTKEVSFTRHILPFLRRLSRFQWTNKGYLSFFGHGSPMDFEDPSLLKKLSTKPVNDKDPWQELRRTIFNAFRPAPNPVFEPRIWPWLYGDAFTGSLESASPRLNLCISEVLSHRLRCWVDGDFVADWDPSQTPPSTLDEVPLAERPRMLDRAALHFGIAHAFNPGSELTWILRHATIFRAPYRIRRRQADDYIAPLSPKLTQKEALQVGGPLYGQRPGDLTRWMALPWQMDATWCRSGYQTEYDPYLPTFWVPRIPNEVLTEKEYRRAMDASQPRQDRLEAFQNRKPWLRSLTGGDVEQILQMVDKFGKLGILEERPGVPSDPDLPPRMWVETLASEPTKASELTPTSKQTMSSASPQKPSKAGPKTKHHEEGGPQS